MHKYVVAAFLSFSSYFSGAQYLRVGDGGYAGTGAGPLIVNVNTANFSSRFAYIFPRSVIGNLKHGDTLTSLEIGRIAGNAFNANCNLAVYFKNTNKSDFGTGKIYWPGEVSGATRVYDQNPMLEIGTYEGFHKIPFYNKLFKYDTTLGSNLEMLVEYKQTATQSATFYWYYEDGSTIPGYAANQCKWASGTTVADSLGTSSDRHPTIAFSFPRYDNDIMIFKAYTLGKIPVPLGNPDSVKALVRNVGKKSQTGIKLQSWVVGPNKNQRDSITFSLALGEEKFINAPSLVPAVKGVDTVFMAIKGDKNPVNDTAFSYRLANENIYSYRDVTLPPDPGGIGFNGSTGDFVARFFSNKSKNINQVTVNFAITGRPFKIGIWQSKANNIPGKLIYLSDSLITISGNYILDLKKPVVVNGSFFVGVRQLNTNNVAFGYQTESPVRPKTFYYAAPMGDTLWQDFYPDAPFKFLIEPRLQGDTDLTVISADYPKDSIDMYVTDTLAPKGTIANIGVKDIKDSFNVYCEIQVFGKTVYKKSYRDTLSSGQKRTYTFPKNFVPKNYGEHVLKIYTSQKSDQIRDNDTMIRKFYVGVKKDVIVSQVYDPPNNAIYEYLLDTLMPVAAVQNVGYDATIQFTARCQIKKGKTILYNKIQNLQLPKFQSKILNWPTYKCIDTGKLTVLFIVEMAGDKNRNNDTAKKTIFVLKSYDAGIDSAKVPDKKTFYPVSKPIKPTVAVYNDGVLSLYKAKLWYRVSSIYTNKIYSDTLYINLQGKEHYSTTFTKGFVPVKRGIYTIVFHIDNAVEFVHSNDSLKYDFFVGNPYDYTAISVLNPLATDTLDVGAGPFIPKIKIKNAGFVKNSDLVPVICNIWWNKIRVYSDIKSLNLDTSQTFDLAFANTFNPVNSGTYEMIANTNYVSDVQRTNDTVRVKFNVKIGRDAYVVSIDSPLITDNYSARSSQIYIKAQIGNKGKLKIAPVRVFAEIYHGAKLESYQFIDDSLLGLETKIIRFKQSFSPKDSGMYTILLRTFSQSDQNIFNDTLIGHFFVNKGKDISTEEWMNPSNFSVLLNTFGSITPKVRIKNVGMDTGRMSGKLYFYILDSAGKSQLFADSMLFKNLSRGKNDTVNANKNFGTLTTGLYRSMAIVKGIGDNFTDNDTLKNVFRIIFNGVKQIPNSDIRIWPNPVNNLLKIESKNPIEKIQIWDISGRKINCEFFENHLNTSALTPGTYLLEISTTQGVFKTHLVKQ